MGELFIKFHSPAHAPLTTPLNIPKGLLDLSVLLDW